jgi:hypothetical protein
MNAWHSRSLLDLDYGRKSASRCFPRVCRTALQSLCLYLDHFSRSNPQSALSCCDYVEGVVVRPSESSVPEEKPLLENRSKWAWVMAAQAVMEELMGNFREGFCRIDLRLAVKSSVALAQYILYILVKISDDELSCGTRYRCEKFLSSW